MKPPVLITGAAGLIGGVLRRALADDFELSGLDVHEGPLAGRRARDLTRLTPVSRAFGRQEVVIDLAADASAEAGWKRVYGNNMLVTFNTFEASRRAGVRRIVFASSTHVTGLYERDPPYADIVAGRYDGLDPGAIPLIGADAPLRPDGLYAVGKAFGEALGRLYAEEHGLSVICLRIGSVNREDRPRSPRHFATLLTHPDLVRLVRCAIEAPSGVRFGIFYGVSANRWRFWDLADARETIGYEPADDAERWR